MVKRKLRFFPNLASPLCSPSPTIVYVVLHTERNNEGFRYNKTLLMHQANMSQVFCCQDVAEVAPIQLETSRL